MRYLIFILCLSHQLSNAQHAPYGTWATALLNIKLNDRWSSVTDGGYRTVSGDFIPYQNFFRSGVRYNFNKKWNITGVFAFFNTKTSFLKENHEYGHEFRFAQDFTRLSLKSNKAIFNHRLRIEEKFYDATSTRRPFNAMRFQYRFLMGWQFSPYLNFQSGPEFFENWIKSKFLFDQVRWYNILGILPGKGFGIALGYYYVHRKAYNQNIFAITLSKNIQWHEHHQQ